MNAYKIKFRALFDGVLTDYEARFEGKFETDEAALACFATHYKVMHGELPQEARVVWRKN